MPSFFAGEVLERLPRLTDSLAHLATALSDRQALLLERAQLLDEPDRTLLRMAIKSQMTVREIALVHGRNHGSIARRVRLIKRRLCDPIVVALLDERCPLSRIDREVALDHYLRSRPVACIIRQRQLSRREIARSLDHVRGWFDGCREGARLTRDLLARTRNSPRSR